MYVILAQEYDDWGWPGADPAATVIERWDLSKGNCFPTEGAAWRSIERSDDLERGHQYKAHRRVVSVAEARGMLARGEISGEIVA